MREEEGEMKEGREGRGGEKIETSGHVYRIRLAGTSTLLAVEREKENEPGKAPMCQRSPYNAFTPVPLLLFSCLYS